MAPGSPQGEQAATILSAMGHKSPFTKEIHGEWDRLLHIEPWPRATREPPTEQVEGWRTLYSRTFSGTAWTVSAADASLVASMGYTIAWRPRRYEDAAALAELYLGHPNADLTYDLSHFAVELGRAWILCGRIDEGVARLVAELEGPFLPKASRRNMVRLALGCVLEDLEPTQPPDPRVTAFVGLLLTDWPGNKRKARKALACKSNSDLDAVLESTYTSA